MRLWPKQQFQWIKRHISMVAFGFGFVFDAFTLTRIDLVYENFVFVSYLLVAAVGILTVHAVETGRWAPKLLKKFKPWLPALVQFPIGGLFSGFVIFYTKSASIFSSWIFLAILLVLFVGNEFLHRRYERLVFQVTMFYFALFSYLIMLVPIILGTMGAGVFVLSGLTSLFLITLLLQGVMRLFPDVYKRSVQQLTYAIGGVFVLFNVLYFANVIPPVPLALKNIDIYHSIVRVNDVYRVTLEQPEWYEFWRDSSGTFHRMPGGAAYCFSAVFAPTRITTDIYHVWMRKSTTGAWVREGRIPFAISGGRESGYRGYTIKTNLPEGDWRCVVETEGGQVLGEAGFVVVDVEEQPTLIDAER